jgi:tetratricopeptide (TPR) repeat protein
MYPPGATITSLEQLDGLIDWLYHNPDAPGHIPVLSSEMKQLYQLWARGQELEDKGQFEQAIDAYKRALQIAPAFINARFSWARSLQALGKYQEAINQLKVITSFFTTLDSSIYIQMALIYHEIGDRNGEIQAYEKALQIDPYNLYGWLNLGLVCRLAGELESSSQAFTEAVARLDVLIQAGKPHQYDPEEDKVCFEAGRTEFARGEFDRAEALFARVMAVRSKNMELWGDPQHNPTVFYTLLFLARIDLRNDKWNVAKDRLQPCLDFAPDDPTVRLLAGNATAHGSDPLPTSWIWEEM